jgi:hypothetical protein
MSTKNTATAKENKEPVTYMGPDIKNVAVHGTTYTDGIPESLTKKVEQVPALKGLLLPVSKLATASVAIATAGTALNNLYNTAADKLAELK